MYTTKSNRSANAFIVALLIFIGVGVFLVVDACSAKVIELAPLSTANAHSASSTPLVLNTQEETSVRQSEQLSLNTASSETFIILAGDDAPASTILIGGDDVPSSTPAFDWTDDILLLSMFEGGALWGDYSREGLRGTVLTAQTTRNRLLHETLFEDTIADEVASGQYAPHKSLESMRSQMLKWGWTDEHIASYIVRLRSELNGEGEFNWSDELSLSVYFYKRDEAQKDNKWWKSLPKLASVRGQTWYGLSE